MQPSANSHLYFLITEGSILASVVKQPQEIIVQKRKVRIGVDGPQFLGEVTAATLVSDVRCVGLHCRAEGSHTPRDSRPFSSCE